MSDPWRLAVAAWVLEDPDPVTRAEVERLLAAGTAEADAELRDRFDGRLRFGTAGLRGAVGAGPNRMNRAVVRLATAAVAAWLADRVPGAAQAGVVVGCDARHGSAAFAAEATGVLAGAGFRVWRLEERRPTPLLAFAVRHLRAAAGVMITASHNPAPDNGYKLYLGDGAQIIPPADREIEGLMDAVGPLSSVPVGDASGSGLVTPVGASVAEAFVAALVAEAGGPAEGAADLRIAYTPMHGVAGETFQAVLAAAGYPAPQVVAAQAVPDPDFPTVPFPNPEEPGAMDLVVDLARSVGANVAVATDPDGDRLAVAVPDRGAPGGWRVLTGDQVGSLLGAYVLDRTSGDDRLVASTVVSSSLLSKVAAGHGVRYVETLTGFKWIVRAAEAQPGSRFVFGYEEALGYAVGTVVRDKDGLGAALAFLGLTGVARARGLTVLDLLDDLEARYGVHLTSQLSLRSGSPAAVMARLRQEPPLDIGGRPVRSVEDLAGGGRGLPPSDVLIYRLDGARLVVRPSGTEPKLKVYLEVVRAAEDAGLDAARAAAGAEMADLRAAAAGLVGA